VFSLHAIKGSSLQIGALRVAKAASVLEERVKSEEKNMEHALDKLKTRFARFVGVFEEYIAESRSAPVNEVSGKPVPMEHKAKSEELAVAKEPDMNRLNKSL
jgi:hypothetical protein